MRVGLSLNIGKTSPAPVYSLLFNGSTQYGVLDAAAGDIDTDKGTYSAWIKFNGTSSNNDTFIMASVDTNNKIGMLYLTSTEVFRFLYKAGGTSKTIEIATTAEATQNWIHLAMTWNTSADELKAYVNGSQVGSTVGSLGTFSGTIDTVTVGKNSLADNTYFIGYLSEVAIFDDVVGISDLYNGGDPVDISVISDIVGYWKVKEGIGTALIDSSKTGNTGSVVNTPTWEIDAP